MGGGFGGGHMGGVGGGRIGGEHVAGMGHDHSDFGRRRFGGMYGDGLDCPYYRTYAPPYNCIY
jgi:hypothetical protein